MLGRGGGGEMGGISAPQHPYPICKIKIMKNFTAVTPLFSIKNGDNCILVTKLHNMPKLALVPTINKL